MLWKAWRRRSGWFHAGRSPSPTTRSGLRSIVMAFGLTGCLLVTRLRRGVTAGSGGPSARRVRRCRLSGFDRPVVANQSAELLVHPALHEPHALERRQDGFRIHAVLDGVPPVAHQGAHIPVARPEGEDGAHDGPDVEAGQEPDDGRAWAGDLEQEHDAARLQHAVVLAKGEAEIGHVPQGIAHAEEVEARVAEG